MQRVETQSKGTGKHGAHFMAACDSRNRKVPELLPAFDMQASMTSHPTPIDDQFVSERARPSLWIKRRA